MVFDERNKQDSKKVRNNAENLGNLRLVLKVVIPTVVALFLLTAIFAPINNNDNKSKNLVKTKRKLVNTIDSPTPMSNWESEYAIPGTITPTPLPTPMSNWSYSTRAYAMSNRNIGSAYIRSTNSFIFDFPYGGLQKATLTLRKHPRWGREVILRIERGQFICHSYSNCRVLVRFDKGKARYYRAVEPSDSSSDVIFIRGYRSFVSRLKRAKKLYIEATFHNEGVRVLEFDVEGLKF